MRLALFIVAVILAGIVVWFGSAFVTATPSAADSYYCWDCSHAKPKPRRAKRYYAKRQSRERIRYNRSPDIIWDDPHLDDGKRTPECQPFKVRTVSTEHQSCEAAIEAGRKHWSGTVQWEFGGQYMNLDNARQMQASCDQTNDMASASGALSSIGGQIQGKAGVNVRYEIVARPCRKLLAPVEGSRNDYYSER
jgi:hypothetical protein